VAFDDLLEIDQYALSRAAQLQADILGTRNPATGVFEGGHFGQYEFHPVVSKLQLYCSEDLGAFYLDVLKDRLYTSAPQSLARRSAQTALHHITHAMLRWMSPFLSFTAEEAWGMFGNSESIFLETFVDLGPVDSALLAKWARIGEIRNAVNKDIEAVRAEGKLGSSLQANIALQVNADDYALLNSLGEDLKFVFITSAIALTRGEALATQVHVSPDTKCERCWHYRDDVGHDATHPTLCGRCTSNLYGDGEVRHCA
jgi:isoleucyl-tRNA synthetase